ncbi:DMT family transporter [Lacticaseibacillus brantae]|uniref:Uncharacterized protein n=1 Tax=Lacticaseibacillus brantae DSM 23927 TaxID=1423727 RepID=A0A0R2B143_9LACO|nr:multidrug efflux SMR transporter [Lacticaseibacillus brantae]KRM73063.1 hypothetical protein FC34_GL000784 [Lacticaseibacillus brantae DSM 23927]
MRAYLLLGVAIVGELAGTSLLKLSRGFSRLSPGILALVAYGVCFYCLALAMRTIPLSVTYALWCGIGMVLTTLIAWWGWHEPISILKLSGIALILVGTVVLSLND